ARRGTVETEALLNHEGRPPAEGQREDEARDTERAEEDETGRDHAESEAAHRLVEPVEAAREPEDEERGEVDRCDQHAEAGPRPRIALRAAIAVGVVEVPEFGRQRAAEVAQVERVCEPLDGEVEEERGQDDGGPEIHIFYYGRGAGSAGRARGDPA